MTVRLLLHLHKAVHKLQNMSKPGSTICMSRSGPITFRANNDPGDEKGRVSDDEEAEHFAIRTVLSDPGPMTIVEIDMPLGRESGDDVGMEIRELSAADAV